MLYDPKWNPKPSLAGFKAWLEQQPPEKTFEYSDCGRCAVGQYLASIGTCWGAQGDDPLSSLNWYAWRAWSEAPGEPTFGDVLAQIAERAPK